MASSIPLNDLIEALAGAVVEAQDRIEQHQIAGLLGYFDKHNRPKSLLVRLPAIHPHAEKGAEELYRAPLLPLVSRNQLKIKDVEMTFDVDLGDLKEEAPVESAESGGDEGRGRGQGARKSMSVVMAAGGTKKGSIHVVLRVEGAEPTEGVARLMNHLTLTQGVVDSAKP